MESQIIDKLNEEQKKPALLINGPVLVTAGAGSGKTRLLTHRIAHLVQDHGVDPRNILAITFTNKAAAEMKERIFALTGSDSNNMWIFTFHSMCSRILRIHADRVGLNKNFSIYGDTEKDRLIKRILKENPAFLSLEKNKLKPDTVSYHISNAKNELLSPDEYAVKIKNDRYVKIIIDTYVKYQRELLLANAVDFDDLLVKVYDLLKDNDDVREFYQTKFKYIHVDEFQDTNVVQYELVRLLGEKYNNIFAVGDEDQCIYSWRGAKFTNVAKFIDDNKPDISIFKLEQNYRSSSKILDTANKIIANNKNRIVKNLWTENEGGKDIKFLNCYSDHEEAEFVASTIKEMVDGGEYKYSDFACLMRINSLSRVLEEKFLNYNVPYKMYGGFKFFERKEVKDALAYLKILSNPKDNDSFLRILAFPKKGIGEATVTKLVQASEETNLSYYELVRSGMGLDESTIKKLSPTVDSLAKYIEMKDTVAMSNLFEKVIDEFGVKTAYSRTIEEELTKILNIETLQKSILDFEEANENVSIDDYLQSVTLARDIDSLDEEDNNVSLMTIHSAKGLEFKVVFIIGLVEGILPLSRAIYALDDNELEEERRLMYVATTRAKELLYYTRPTSKFSFETKRTESTSPSRFLKEAGVLEIMPESRGFGERRTFEEDNYRSSFASDSYGSRYNNYGSRSGGSSYSSSYGSSSSRSYANADLYVPEKEEDYKKPTISVDKLNEYKKYKKGTIVSHKSFGRGVVTLEVTDMTNAFVTIKFDTVGIKTLSLKFAPLTIIGE